MPKPAVAHLHLDDVRGLKRLTIAATTGIVSLVETIHANIARISPPLGKAPPASARGISGLVYKSVRGTTRVVGGGLELALSALAPMLPAGESSRERDSVVSVLNGVLGDYLEQSGNPLALPMSLRANGRSLALNTPALRDVLGSVSGRVVVLAHGLCMNDVQWLVKGHDHGRMLTDDGFTPVYLRYNTGRHISENGADFSAVLEQLVASWPVPIERLVIIGHSMGGLVARAACACAESDGTRWLPHLSDLIFLGSPHFGSPLEKGGNWLDLLLDASPYTVAFNRLGQIRSAGITDLRHGYVSAADWEGHDRFARHPAPTHSPLLPSGVRCYAVAGSLADPPEGAASRFAPGKGVLGDGLVMPASALGRHRTHARDLGIPRERQFVAYRTGHIALLGSAEVAERIRTWLNSAG